MRTINISILFLLVLLSCGGESMAGYKKINYVEDIAQKLKLKSEKLKNKYKNLIISEIEAIRIAKEYRRHKEYGYIDDSKKKVSVEYLKNDNYEYPYELDWEHPHIRLEERALKKDGSLSSGFGKKFSYGLFGFCL